MTRTPSPILGCMLVTCLAGCAGGRDSAPYYDGKDPRVSERLPATGTIGGSQGSGSGSTTADIVLLRNANFDGYLSDSDDRALYVFANDIPASRTSACNEACLDAWPVFDVKDISVGQGLLAGDFERFQRADGQWQTTFKGHPLYRFAMDGDTAEVSGDGVGGRWFVARDYFAMSAAQAAITPEGAEGPGPYMTNRAGRTVYAFLNDMPGDSASDPASACTDGCLDAWPVWAAPSTLDALILPSNMRASDFGSFDRDVGGRTQQQLTYRGYPLYFNTRDDLPGETSGHLTGAWRALDPISFAATGNENAAPGIGY